MIKRDMLEAKLSLERKITQIMMINFNMINAYMKNKILCQGMNTQIVTKYIWKLRKRNRWLMKKRLKPSDLSHSNSHGMTFKFSWGSRNCLLFTNILGNEIITKKDANVPVDLWSSELEAYSISLCASNSRYVNL